MNNISSCVGANDFERWSGMVLTTGHGGMVRPCRKKVTPQDKGGKERSRAREGRVMGKLFTRHPGIRHPAWSALVDEDAPGQVAGPVSLRKSAAKIVKITFYFSVLICIVLELITTVKLSKNDVYYICLDIFHACYFQSIAPKNR